MKPQRTLRRNAPPTEAQLEQLKKILVKMTPALATVGRAALEAALALEKLGQALRKTRVDPLLSRRTKP